MFSYNAQLMFIQYALEGYKNETKKQTFNGILSIMEGIKNNHMQMKIGEAILFIFCKQNKKLLFRTL